MKLINGETKSLRKGTWSPEEDQMLLTYIRRYGIWNWSLIMPKAAGLLRTGKSCRLRWMNYLKPTIKRGRLSIDEIQMIIKLQKSLGNKWSQIAEKMPGRTDNDIKNFWNTYIRKRVGSDGANNLGKDLKRIKQENKKTRGNETKDSFTLLGPKETEYYIAESFSFSEESNSSSENNDRLETTCNTFEVKNLEVEGNILTDPFLMEPYFEESNWRLQDYELTTKEFHINDGINSCWFNVFLEEYRMEDTTL